VRTDSAFCAVTLHYDLNDGEGMRTRRMHFVNFNENIDGEPFQYQAELPAQPAQARIDYYIEAEDAAGFVTTSPAGAPAATHAFYVERILADAGYRGHTAPLSHKFRVFTTGQKRRMTPAIKREMRRRAAVEPVIGHIKNEHRMDRNYLAHAQGDAVNAILAAAGYNFRLILKWIRILCALSKIWMTPNYQTPSVQITA